MPINTLHSEPTEFLVQRRATGALEKDGKETSETKALEDWRELDAYVLLGDPGAGKSLSFAREAKLSQGVCVAARDVIDGVAPALAPGAPVFIDGLDEVQAGATDTLTPLGRIRHWLHQQGKPRMRISCREADWLGDVDRRRLDTVAPGGTVQVLHLDPLDDDDVREVLLNRPDEVPDPEGFLQSAERWGLRALMANPLLLDLIIKARIPLSQSAGWNRRDVYQRACEQMAREHSDMHQALRKARPGEVEQLIQEAGLLCAVQLLSGRVRMTTGHSDDAAAVGIADLPGELGLHTPELALASKLFTQGAYPRHRTIAEFLAAGALAKRIDQGLPLDRVLALILGIDGKPVEPLRGLLAWLAVQYPPGRARLLGLDPLGMVLNGDVASFTTGERLQLLQALAEEARRDPWFRRDAWASAPWGALATQDMSAAFEQLLRDPKRDEAHQSVIDCVLDALQHGELMPALAPALALWVEDAAANVSNRLGAYRAWKRHEPGVGLVKQQRQWLDALHDNRLSDSADDQLTGALLTDLYPEHLGPEVVFRYLRPTRQQKGYANYADFWQYTLLRQSRPEDHALLADAWASWLSRFTDPARDHVLHRLGAKILCSALESDGDKTNIQRLYTWLGIPIDEYGSSRLSGTELTAVREWLQQRPDRMKAVVTLGYTIETTAGSEPHKLMRFWRAEQHLHGAQRPRDWLFWLLDQAAQATDDALAEHLFGMVAQAVQTTQTSWDLPSLEQIEQWVEAQAVARPKVREWLAREWTSDLKSAHHELHSLERKHLAKAHQAREKRRIALLPHLSGLATGAVPPSLLRDIALVHEGRLGGFAGDTPLDRLQEFLVSDADTAQAAIAGLQKVLDRDDLPSADDVLKIEAEGKYHHIRAPALLAAKMAVAEQTDRALEWHRDAAERMVAFHLTEGGISPGWYHTLADHRAEWVAPIFLRHALTQFKRLKRNGTPVITGVHDLSEHTELARAVLPQLLERFPLKASESARSLLNHSLLPLITLLDESWVRKLIDGKLAKVSMDPMQRIAWLVADLSYRAKAADELADWTQGNERRAMVLGEALREQKNLKRLGEVIAPETVARLIEILAPITPYDPHWPGGFVSTERHREETVAALLSLLAATPGPEASERLEALKHSATMGNWQVALERSVIDQRQVSREASFAYATPRAVALSLAHAAPATVPDLQAMAIEQLKGIEAEIRGADTFGLRHFWNESNLGRKPWDEPRCRDEVVTLLRQRLRPLNIDISTESRMAREKRSDFLLSHLRNGNKLCLPVEVKKEDHDTLWTAWRDQLQRLYTIHPDAQGYGLYLVLWFGLSPKPRPNREGPKPKSAKALEELIRSRIPPEDRHRLAVVVLDLSWPEP